MDREDFEIAKKGLAREIASLVGEFAKNHSFGSIDVNVFLTDADASVTDQGEVKYGRILHCVVDTDKEFEGDDYE